MANPWDNLDELAQVSGYTPDQNNPGAWIAPPGAPPVNNGWSQDYINQMNADKHKGQEPLPGITPPPVAPKPTSIGPGTPERPSQTRDPWKFLTDLGNFIYGFPEAAIGVTAAPLLGGIRGLGTQQGFFPGAGQEAGNVLNDAGNRIRGGMAGIGNALGPAAFGAGWQPNTYAPSAPVQNPQYGQGVGLPYSGSLGTISAPPTTGQYNPGVPAGGRINRWDIQETGAGVGAPTVPTTPTIVPPGAAPAAPGAPATPPTTPTGTEPSGAPFKEGGGATYDANTKLYTFKLDNSQLRDFQIQDLLSKAGAPAGVDPQRIWDFMASTADSQGKALSSADFTPDILKGVVDYLKGHPEQGVSAPKAGGAGVDINQPMTANAKVPYGNPGFDTKLPYIIPNLPWFSGDFYGGANYYANPYAPGTKEWNERQIEVDRRLKVGKSTGYSGGGGGGGGEVTPPTTTPPTAGITEANVRPFDMTGPTVKLDPSDLKALSDISPAYAPLFQNLMQAAGYIPTGFLGQYGETEYTRPTTGSGQVTADMIAQVTTDAATQAWLKWLAYRKGIFSAASPWPQVTAPITPGV